MADNKWAKSVECVSRSFVPGGAGVEPDPTVTVTFKPNDWAARDAFAAYVERIAIDAARGVTPSDGCQQ